MEVNIKNVTKMDVKSLDIWTPFKELCSIVERCILDGDEKAACTLQILLPKYKQDFLSPYQNPPKNEKSKAIIIKGFMEGINIPPLRFPTLSKEIMEHVFILSNMYNLDELMALNLLRIAQSQIPNFPGLPRGLVAVLLYYDGHKSIISALRTIMQGRSGHRWDTDIGSGIPSLFASFTNELVHEGLIEKIIGVLKTKNLASEFEMLYKNEAVGPPKHRYLIESFFKNTKQFLADIIFFYSAQAGLRKEHLLALIDYLSDVAFGKDSTDGDNDVVLTMHMAFLFAIDASFTSDNDKITLICESEILAAALEKLRSKEKHWACSGLHAFSLFALAIAIRRSRNSTRFPLAKGEEDKLVALSLTMDVFTFLHSTYLKCSLIHKEEFFMRKLHGLMTDFIVSMPLIIADLRTRGEESCQTARMYIEQSLNPPVTLNRHFEMFLMCFGPLYENDPLNLKLHLDYWFDETMKTAVKHSVYKSVSHQIVLFRFVRTASIGLSAMLLVPFLKFLSSLIQCRESAQLAFRYLKMNTENCLNLNHFFESFSRYLNNLHVERLPTTDIIYQHKTSKKEIISTEIQGLHAVLCIIHNIASHDSGCRLALYENREWSIIQVFFGLLSCPVDIELKANIVKVLATLCKSEEPIIAVWNSLESSQLIRTAPSTSINKQSNFQTELDQVESLYEKYPLTRAVLKLCTVLAERQYSRQLGIVDLQTGFDPFLYYVVNVIFLPAESRSYVDPREKYDILDSSMELFLKCVERYEPDPADLATKREESVQNKPIPRSSGFHIMMDMFMPGSLFRTIMNLVNDGCELFQAYREFPTKAQLESITLKCLKLIDKTLMLQSQFLETFSESQLILNPFSNSLQALNSKTGMPDHILNIVKYITFNSWLPEHALAAIKILVNLTNYRIDHSMILSFYISNSSLMVEIRHGFVECLEADETKLNKNDGEDTVAELKINIIQFLLRCLKISEVNIAYYLLGFNLHSIKNTVLRQPSYNDPRTCLHSIILLLNTYLSYRKANNTVTTPPRVNPALITIVYKALYVLCANGRTSDSVLRFLRASDNILHKQILCLPFCTYHPYVEMECMSWLLKSITIELRVLVKIGQQSRLQELCSLLLTEITENNEKSLQIQPFTNIVTVEASKKMTVVLTNCRLYIFHNVLQYIASEPEISSWQYFNKDSVPKILNMCKSNHVIDVKKLRVTLMNELAANPNLSTSGQRPLIMDEINVLIKYAENLNKRAENCQCSLHFVDSYKNLVSIFFDVVPKNILSFKGRFTLLIELIICLLQKATEYSQIIPAVSSGISEGLVLLFNQVEYVYRVEKNIISTEDDKRKLNIFFRTFDSYSTRILRYLCDWIVNIAQKSKEVNVHLYACLLMFLNLYSGAVVTNSNADIVATNIYDVIYEKVIETIYNDSLNTVNICQILSLTCLGVIVEAEPKWMSFLFRCGFSENLGKSLVDSEAELTRALNPAIDDTRPLCIYEAKMMFFCKLAVNTEGARRLLNERLLDHLSTMNVYNLHPNSIFRMRTERNLSLDVTQRYLLLFTPMLKLCKCLLHSLEGQKTGGIMFQIASLLLNYNESITLILRNGSPHLESCFITELADLTFVIMKTFRRAKLYARADDSSSFASGIQKVQKLMITLLVSFDMSEPSINIVADINCEVKSNAFVKRTKTLVSYLKIILHVLLYIEKILSESKVGRFITEPLFEPIMNKVLRQPGVGYNGYNAVVNIGAIIQYIVDGVPYYLHEKENLEGLVNKTDKIPTLKTDEIKEAFPFLDLTEEDDEYARNKAKVSLEKLIRLKHQEINTCYLIVETALFVLWSHLDYYMLQILPTKGVRNELHLEKTANPLEMQKASWKESVKQINELQNDLIAVFNDTFTAKLMMLTKDKSMSQKSYIEGLVNRVKKLIQFFPNQ